MIVRGLDDGSLILINQTDHAKLSGLFAAHWGNAVFARPEPREAVIRAAMFHDSGWNRYETSPLYDSVAKSSPTFFQAPNDGPQLAAFGHAIDWLTEIDSYAGLLIGRHRTGLWKGRYGAVQHPTSVSRRAVDESVATFIAHYEGLQEAALATLDRRAFAVNYQLLQIWDLLSLALCIREPADELFEFAPTSYEGDGKTGERMQMTVLGGDKIRLTPYPFDTRPLSLGFVYRHLPTSDFPDQAAFRQAYFAATPKTRVFEFV